ncbi:MAG: 2-oxoacid:acceptor oxidoreductase family protein [Gammaproteobacteria bacterium]|jgi:indolepyruvate ferredoxin oxidoreductase, beta subunit|nr:2-oxoacid:acceptor oxidoreductase family protein [Gammaproteobacteria bacterium]MBU2222605.1 2-oxoacid:acceptor oxidoreductase family protein [Gammaproteobacteria bacterium]MBU2277165.1 2-oxoacid:acceptor oxidoreductase family protein [Gammaproteobacteria bacterium]MBU2426457.1 2-oxoacid:acceptor oxidoreductase family protein [Gammaproteobacteria bacterium]
MRQEYTNVVITGVGGLGNILLTRLMGMALYQRHSRVITSEERGIAQRTGSVSAVVRAGRQIETSCLYSQHTDYLLGLEPLEALRKLSFCQRGTMTLLSDLQFPIGRSLARQRQYPDFQHIVQAFRSHCAVLVIPMRQLLGREQLADRFSSAVMFGVFCASYGFSQTFAAQLLSETVAPAYLEANQRALATGFDWLEQQNLPAAPEHGLKRA